MTTAKIIACARKGHQWRETLPPRCRRCGLLLVTTGRHWQHKNLEPLWIKP